MTCRSPWAMDLSLFCLVQKVSESGICKKRLDFGMYMRTFFLFSGFRYVLA